MAHFDLFKQACWLHTRLIIGRYLISNAHGQWNGAEKAQRHMELCQFYVAVMRGYDDPDNVRPGVSSDYQKVHLETQKLTDRLDEKIGFPLDAPPDLDKFEPLFFDQFHDLAVAALSRDI
jgi:hypothetical protein